MKDKSAAQKGGADMSYEEMKLLALEYAKLSYKENDTAVEFAIAYEKAMKEIYDYVCTPKD